METILSLKQINIEFINKIGNLILVYSNDSRLLHFLLLFELNIFKTLLKENQPDYFDLFKNQIENLENIQSDTKKGNDLFINELNKFKLILRKNQV
jgi:hypothetical protein